MTLSSEDDPFGWAGDDDQEHLIMSDQGLFCKRDEQMEQRAAAGPGVLLRTARDDTASVAIGSVNTNVSKPDRGSCGVLLDLHDFAFRVQ